MLRTKLFCVIFMVVTCTCEAKKIFEIHESEDNSNLVKATVKVLTSCYGQQYGAFGLVGEPSEALLKALWSSQSQPIVLIDNTTKAVINDSVRRQLQYKLQLFIVVATSSPRLLQLLRQIKESQWWNHIAFFLIISEPPMNACSNAKEILQVAWKMNLLNAKFMCCHATSRLLLYGYNIYTRRAPEPWRLVNTFASEDDHPWTLFERQYRDDDSVCHELDFDKTTDLGGYKIRSTVKTLYAFDIGDIQSGIDSFSGENGIMTQILFRAMHANATLHLYNATDGPSHSDKNGRSITMDVVSGYTDIMLNPLYQHDVENLTFSIPIIQSGLSILTQYSREMSQLRKILAFIDPSSRYGVLVVFFVTFIFFKVFRKENSVSTFLNLVRLLSNSSLLKVPKNIPARVYLISFFLFSITIQALYQGQLASRLTKSMFFPNVDSFQDLAEQTHAIHGSKGIAYLFNEPRFKGRFKAGRGHNCTETLVRDSSVACVASRLWLIDSAKEFNLHLSRDSFEMLNVVYLMREDWPLEQRFNIVIAAMIEAGVLQREQTDKLRDNTAKTEFYKMMREQDRFEVITLSQLMFAFVILGIGLALATLSFIVEVAIA